MKGWIIIVDLCVEAGNDIHGDGSGFTDVFG
jgi:hypothetical protein